MTMVGHVGKVLVTTTDNGGHDVEFWTDAATKRIVSVGENTHPLIREQALAFQEQIHKVVGYYIREAIKSDRATLAAEVEAQGQPDLANIIRSLT
jgi:hypothetical protein